MILVTGATGLLGSHLLIELTKMGAACRAIYRAPHKIDEVRSLFQYYFRESAQEKWALIEWTQCDLLHLSELEDAMTGVDYVYHCAAVVSFFKIDFEACIQNNRVATENLVNYALKHQIKKLCYVSSTAAVGVKKDGFTTELDKWEPGGDVSGYSVSKFLAEKEVWRGIEEGINAVIINPCVIFGPGNWNGGSLEIFKAAKRGMPFYPPGSNAIVDARDVVCAMIQLMESPIQKERFLCIGHNSNFFDLFAQLTKSFGRKPPRMKVSKPAALFFAWWNEFFCYFSGRRSGISTESVESGFKKIIYDRSKLDKAIQINFHSIEDTIENAINGSKFMDVKKEK